MHYLSPYFSPDVYSPLFGFTGAFILFLIVATIWTIVLKGFALWHAAHHNQKWWFIAILVINTLGILEIIYLVWFRPKTSVRVPTAVSESSDTAQ